jgi:DNA-binding GntR family transcriptional regulator
MKIEKLRHKNLSEKVYELLKDKIIRWELKPGERLIDNEFARKMGVSRSLVKTTFAVLEKEGLITISRRGTYVAYFTEKKIQEIYEVRKLLESFALESSITNISQYDLDEIERKMRLSELELEKRELKASYNLDLALHHLIINKCNNSEIKKICSNFRNILGFPDYSKTDDILQAFEEHTRIFNAITKRDFLEAKKALIDHLSNAMERVIRNSKAMATSIEEKAGSI